MVAESLILNGDECVYKVLGDLVIGNEDALVRAVDLLSVKRNGLADAVKTVGPIVSVKLGCRTRNYLRKSEHCFIDLGVNVVIYIYGKRTCAYNAGYGEDKQ